MVPALIRLLVAALLVLAPAAASAQLRSTLLVAGLNDPVALVPDPAFADVFYVVEQGGLVRVVRDGVLLPVPFADFTALTTATGERGLLGMAFAPNTASGRVFFNYTNLDGHTVVARYRRTSAAPLTVDVSTRLDLRWPNGERFIRQPAANHNGGHLAFGPDGFLYVGLGDGGGSNDPNNHAQNPDSLLGKMLRLDVSVPDADPKGYQVPPDNPFVDGVPLAARHEIWAFGLRNPWRYAFDDLGAGATGALIIGDVGQGAREEIDYEPRGAGGRNYGWRLREGRLPTPGVTQMAPAYGPLTDPIHEYPRADGQAVTGGFVYRGQALGAAYRGRYFFADYVRSRVWSLALTTDAATGEATAGGLIEHTGELGGALGGIAAFGRDLDGELYLVTFAGEIRKIESADAGGVPGAPREARAVVSGSTVTISWLAPSTGALPTGYVLEAGPQPGSAAYGFFGAGASQTTLVFSGVSPGIYFVRVFAINGTATSAASDELTIIVSAGGCVGAPPSPVGLTATVNGRLVLLSWTIPSTADGPTSFVLEAGSATGLANIASIVIDAAVSTVAVQAPPGQYFVRLRGRNPCGTGPVSNEIVITVF